MCSLPLNIYAEELIAHYEHPHNKRVMKDADASIHEYNPLCGDDVTFYIKVGDGKIADISFDGKGCAISIGCSSMLTDYAKGKSLESVDKMDFETIKRLLGMDPGPARAKCATIGLKALQGATFAYEHGSKAGKQKG